MVIVPALLPETVPLVSISKLPNVGLILLLSKSKVPLAYTLTAPEDVIPLPLDQKVPDSIYNEMHRHFAQRLTSTNKEKWETFASFFKECDDYREKYKDQI